MFRSIRLFSVALLVCFAAGLIHGTAFSDDKNPGKHPKLLVLVVFDQMRGDYLQRWSHLYGTDGFNLLTREGAWFTNCHYPYSMTVTGAGHATLGTGCVPAQHGIIENDWYDRTIAKSVNCATLGDRYHLIPEGTKRKTNGGTPERLLVPSLGDMVKEATHSKGKVIGLSLKDRGGILPTGAKADMCFWFDSSVGAFVSSDYFAGNLPSYMTAFNNTKYADKWFGKDWDRFRRDISYTDCVGPDDVTGEGSGTKQGRTFPHPMTGGEAAVGPKFYSAVYSSPMGNDLLWAAAQVVLDNEKLGRNEQTDYLVISYSSNDAVGHTWGPDSQEVLDVTLRSDRIVAEMIQYLDKNVGRANYVLAMSADHGICPLPDVAKSKGLDAGRIDSSKEIAALEIALNAKYPTTGKWVEAIAGAGLYLNTRTIKASGRSQEEVESAVAAWFKERPYVQDVYTRTQLVKNRDLPPLGIQCRNSFHPDRSGDIMPLLKPYWFLSKYSSGTTHGSPNQYDTHVPLVFFGGGIRSGKHDQRVSPQLAAVTLAHSIGQRMKNSTVEIVPEVFK